MHIRLLFFGPLAEAAGKAELSLELPLGATVTDAVQLLCEREPKIRPKIQVVATAVNERYVGREHRMADGDRLALIPPVSGG